jgi:hypothetical protein
MPPPDALKKKLAQRIKAIESDDVSLDSIDDESSSRPRKDPHGLSKVARLGVPPPPSSDFPLPQPKLLGGTPRQRIKCLVESIWRPEFLAVIRSTNFFDIRSETAVTLADGEVNKSIHLGENYTYHAVGTDSYRGVPVPAHAWIILSASSVWQWHYVHPGCETEGAPTFLLSLENYLMYMHLRCDQPLPFSIFDADEDLRGWMGKTYQD